MYKLKAKKVQLVNEANGIGNPLREKDN